MSLAVYKKKRDFKKTNEPRGRVENVAGHSFVIQKHNASHLHYDFRLELDGVLKSWAVPKGPSLDPKVRRLAVEVEDHPVSYRDFEGEIPRGEYGGGWVLSWDRGHWRPLDPNPREALRKGRLEFELRGEKLHGRWILVRTHSRSKKPNWLLMKRNDQYASTRIDIISEKPESVLTKRTLEEIEAGVSTLPSKKNSRTSRVQAKSSAKESSAVPGFIEPQLATLVQEPPNGAQWVHEIKFDGYRTQVRLESRGRKKQVQLFSRNGLDWTTRFGDLAQKFGHLKVRDAILDGEVVAVDTQGRSRFSALQNELTQARPKGLLYYAFDLLYVDGEDLRTLPLLERKQKLAKLLESLPKKAQERILLSEHWSTSAQGLLKQSCRLELEGIVSKRTDAPFESGRNDNFVKSKCGHDQEFIVAGITPPKGSRQGFGALLLGLRDDDGGLTYVGRVGTGFNDKTLRTLMRKFKPLFASSSPFTSSVPEERNVQWLKPSVVAQVKFAGWTDDRILRHASFAGLREDKPARQVKADQVKKLKSVVGSRKTSSVKTGTKARVEGVVITHPDRVIFVKSKMTKMILAEYYAAVSPLLLPHVANRPLSLLRCPDGAIGKCFFQKHAGDSFDNIVHVRTIQLREQKKASEEILYIDSAKDLAGLVQMGVIELHCWNAHIDKLERPNAIVFDLDPAPDVPWSQVVEGAQHIHDALNRLKMASFLKLTGGKGLHVHVPIVPRYTWDEVKNFSRAIVSDMATREPDLYTSNASKSKRGGRIFLDYLRNGYGATAVAPYGVRAREGAPVAMPIEWSALDKKISPDEFTLANASAWLKKRKKDPWSSYFENVSAISVLDEYLEAKPAKRRRPR